MNEIGAFPEELELTPGRGGAAEETIASYGTDRRYDSDLSYADTVFFFDGSLATYGFQNVRRTTTPGATLWSVACAGGGMFRIAVRNATPPTIEVVEGEARAF